jgi:acyl-CoA thioesterase-1
MGKWRIFIAAVALISGACAQPEPRAAGEAQPRASVETPSASDATASNTGVGTRPRIVFLGDSLTAGLGLAPPESVPSLIQERLNREGYDYEVINAGVSGDTSAGGLSRLDWSLEGDVDVLVVELGANDGLRGLPAAQLKGNLDQIIRRAKARGVEVLLTGMEAPPNYGPAYTNEFRQAFRDLAREHDIAFIPFYLDGVAGIGTLNQRDGIHPNAEGSRLIEQSVWRALEPMLDKSDR